MLPVLIAFAGVLVAAVATGMLAGRCARGPRLCFTVWTVAALGLIVALAAAGVGLATGFEPATFRAMEIGGQLIAPLWLTWGLIEFVTRNSAVRFGARLIYGFALTVVAGPVLATGTLSAVPFSKSWPMASQHYQPVSRDVLLLAQVVTVAGTLAVVSVACARVRNEPEWAPAMAGVGAFGLAVLFTVALSFSLPARSVYPLVAAGAAGFVWFGVTRGLRTVDESWRSAGRGDRSRRSSRSRRDDRDSRDQRDSQDSRDLLGPREQRDDTTRYGRRGQWHEPPEAEPGQYAHDPYRQDPYPPDPYRQDPYHKDQYSQDDYYQGQYGQAQGGQYGQAQGGQYGQAQGGQYGQSQYGQSQYGQSQYGQGQGQTREYGQAQRVPDPQDQYAPDPYAHEPYGQSPYGPDSYRQAAYGQTVNGQAAYEPDPYGSAVLDGGYGYEREHGDGYSRDGRYEANGRNGRGSHGAGQRAAAQGAAQGAPQSAPTPTGVPLGQPLPDGTMAEAEFGAKAVSASRGSAQSRPYGRLQIFTLLDDKAADFDRLAEQTAEEVRIGEPDTLVYVIHLVPNAPMQRIFYEIYRDQTAFDSHENKSYTKRFVAERRSYVLATNIIELRLKYAKVAPLPVDSRQLDAGRTARAQLPPGPAAGTPRYDTSAPRYDAAPGRSPASASRHPASSGQWAQPSADPRYGGV
jgi:quinol monooxygenase YgiN